MELERSRTNFHSKSKYNAPAKKDELIDDISVRGTRSLSDINQRSNVVVLEQTNSWEAEKDPKWRVAMKKEHNMIDKNQTWKLMKRPEDREVIGVK